MPKTSIFRVAYKYPDNIRVYFTSWVEEENKEELLIKLAEISRNYERPPAEPGEDPPPAIEPIFLGWQELKLEDSEE